MLVEDSVFYLAQFPDESHLFGDEAEAIDKLKEKSDEIDPQSPDVSIVKVDYTGDDWAIMELPWQQVAIQLLRCE